MALSFLALPLLAADAVPVVDRGLPQANLNDVSGEGRGNIRWTWNDNGLLGDEFAVGAPGVDGREPGADLTPVVTARLAPGSDATGAGKRRDWRREETRPAARRLAFPMLRRAERATVSARGAWAGRSPEARTTTSTRPTPGSTTPRTRR